MKFIVDTTYYPLYSIVIIIDSGIHESMIWKWSTMRCCRDSIFSICINDSAVADQQPNRYAIKFRTENFLFSLLFSISFSRSIIDSIGQIFFSVLAQRHLMCGMPSWLCTRYQLAFVGLFVIILKPRYIIHCLRYVILPKLIINLK